MRYNHFLHELGASLLLNRGMSEKLPSSPVNTWNALLNSQALGRTLQDIYSPLLSRSCISLPAQKGRGHSLNSPSYPGRTSFVETVSPWSFRCGGCVSKEKSHHSPIWRVTEPFPFRFGFPNPQRVWSQPRHIWGNQASFKQSSWVLWPSSFIY